MPKKPPMLFDEVAVFNKEQEMLNQLSQLDQELSYPPIGFKNSNNDSQDHTAYDAEDSDELDLSLGRDSDEFTPPSHYSSDD